MTNLISFGSTYKVSTTSNPREMKAFDKFEDFCAQKELTQGVKSKYSDKINKKYPHDWSAVKTLVVPESMDNEVETYCKLRNIEFKKFNTYDLMNLDSIESRIKDAPKNSIKVHVNKEKLEQLAKNQQNNLKHCEDSYNKYYKKDNEFTLKSADKFPAPTLRIVSNHSSADELIEYIEDFGADNLNKDMAGFYLLQQTDEADHCLFFALSQKGMKDIPVYVDKESYRIGLALGLFS